MGTPIVLIHGLSGSARWWSRNLDALAENHLVAAVDRLPASSFGELTAHLARWLQTFDEPVHLVGHSMGGALAIRLAAERPDLVRSLVLVNATGMPFRLRPGPHLRALPRRPFGLSIGRVLLPDLVRAGPISLALASARVLAGDARAWMQRIQARTLLVWGDHDPLVPLVYGQEMQRLIPNARLEVIPAAHVAMWENPEEFNRLVIGFVAEVERQPLSLDRQPPTFAWGIGGWTNGIAHRQAGRARDIVLVHGLGMSSAYFVRFARALFDRGWNPIAPDLPGFGESANRPAVGVKEHARILGEWAEAVGIRESVWVGHSIGCDAVAALAADRPDSCRLAVLIGPLWTSDRHASRRLIVRLALDALREPLRLYTFVIPAYWRCGLARWWMTFRRYGSSFRSEPPSDALMIAGERDPLPDRTRVQVKLVPGAHACHFSHPAEVADALEAWIKPPRPAR